MIEKGVFTSHCSHETSVTTIECTDTILYQYEELDRYKPYIVGIVSNESEVCCIGLNPHPETSIAFELRITINDNDIAEIISNMISIWAPKSLVCVDVMTCSELLTKLIECSIQKNLYCGNFSFPNQYGFNYTDEMEHEMLSFTMPETYEPYHYHDNKVNVYDDIKHFLESNYSLRNDSIKAYVIARYIDAFDRNVESLEEYKKVLEKRIHDASIPKSSYSSS